MIANVQAKLVKKDKIKIQTKNGEQDKWTALFETVEQFKTNLYTETLNEQTGKKLDAAKIGEIYQIDFIPRSREYNGKYYSQLDLWNIFSESQEPEVIGELIEEEPYSDLPF